MIKYGKYISTIAISSNNAYIASITFNARRVVLIPTLTFSHWLTPEVEFIRRPEDWYSHVTLYTVDGGELWGTEVEGFPQNVDVSTNGEVLLSTSNEGICKTYLIKDGQVLWTKDHCNGSFTKNEDRIIAIKRRGDSWAFSVFNREGELLWEYQGAYRYAVADNYYVLVGGEQGNEEFVLVSTEGVVLQRTKLSELNKEVETANIYVSISPCGRYFAIETLDVIKGICHIYFFENRDPLIRGVKEKLLKEIDELIKR